MPDIFVLRMMAQGLTILDKTYFIAWDCELNRAVITYTQEGQEGVKQMSFSDDTEMTFPTELDAHRYILGVLSLAKEETSDWKKL